MKNLQFKMQPFPQFYSPLRFLQCIKMHKKHKKSKKNLKNKKTKKFNNGIKFKFD